MKRKKKMSTEWIGGCDCDTQESSAPDYNEVTYKSRRTRWFERCKDTDALIWPLTKVWDRTYWNCGGAIVGAPPIQLTETLSEKAYVIRILKDDK